MEDDSAGLMIARYLEAFARANGPKVKPPIIKERGGWFAIYQNGTISKPCRWPKLFEMTMELERRAAIAAARKESCQ